MTLTKNARHRALMIMVIAATLFGAMAFAAKIASSRLSGPEVAMIRMAIGLLPCLLISRYRRAAMHFRRLDLILYRGIFGGIAMAVVACAYGLIVQHSIWYPINLLAAAAMPSLTNADVTQLRLFNGAGFVVALISHGVISLLVGLLYAVLLPMLPSRFSAFWGSLLAPLIWTGLISATLRLINPALNDRIDWIWFIASQVAFGMVTGYVVAHTKTVETVQTWPLAARAGIEAPGITSERRSGQ